MLESDPENVAPGGELYVQFQSEVGEWQLRLTLSLDAVQQINYFCC